MTLHPEDTSPSVQDVADVLPVEPVAALERSFLSKQTGRRGSAINLLVDGSGDAQHRAFQAHENEMAEVIIVCEPEGTSLMMGGLHPRSALGLELYVGNINTYGISAGCFVLNLSLHHLAPATTIDG